MDEKQRAPRNRTVILSDAEVEHYRLRLLHLNEPVAAPTIMNRTICQDAVEAITFLPAHFADLVVIDPPYNLTKTFSETTFSQLPIEEYTQWLERWFSQLRHVLKSTASIYICSEWRSSSAIQRLAENFFNVRNRITWEREKGRDARANWKNCSEDIWFCTVSDDFTFNVDAVKLKRKVLAPYIDDDGMPKDWTRNSDGDFRLTHPSNLWTDVTVPFWSMPENTDHPTQKPEKLIAKLVLASSDPDDVVLDPFLGSGTTSVVAKKLGRRYVGIEAELAFCCLAEKRLDLADEDRAIQGYQDGVFWDRNLLTEQRKRAGASGHLGARNARSLFCEDT